MLSEAMAQNQKNLLELWAEFQKELLSMRMALAPYQKATATKPMSRHLLSQQLRSLNFYWVSLCSRNHKV